MMNKKITTVIGTMFFVLTGAAFSFAGDALLSKQDTANAKVNGETKSVQQTPDSAKEIVRLKKLIAAKDNALDIAIAEIKKQSEHSGGIQVDPKAYSENAGMKEAFQLNGWDVAEFKGVGDIQAKSLKDVTVIKVQEQQALQAAKHTLKPKAKAHFNCGNGAQCYIIANNILLVPSSSAN